jgi:hypothetical protein
MAIDMGRLLAKSAIRSILEKKEEILRSFEGIPGKKASKIRSKIMLDYEQILTAEVKEAFSRCNLTRSRITHLAQGIKNLKIFKNENEIQNLVLSMKWYKNYSVSLFDFSKILSKV